MLRAFDLGAPERHDAGADRGLDIAERLVPRTVDAYEHVGTGFGDLFRGGGHQPPRTLLLGLGHAVLEIEDDAVGAARMRAGNELLAHDGHEQQRAPGGQIGSGSRHQTILSERSLARSASPMPMRARTSAVCSPSFGAARRNAPGVADKRGMTL